MSGICQKCLRCGYEDEKIGQPCESCKDGVIERTPEFRELVDALPEPMTCGRRSDTYVGGIPVHQDTGEGKDHWDKFKRIDNRVCSFCGSLHPDDFFRLVREAAETSINTPYSESVNIERSDKGYKIYVHQPGVRNAHEGGIKFYMQHFPRNPDGSLAVTDEMNKEYAQAIERSNIRLQAKLTFMFPGQQRVQ